MNQIIAFLHLLFAAHQLPDTKAVDVLRFVIAAAQEETPDVPASLLVALGWPESRFQLDAQPACGVMQVYPHDINRPDSDCAVWREDVRAGVHAGVVEIEMLLADRRVNRNMHRALMYRACGNKFFDGTCDAAKAVWVDNAIARWRWLESTGIGT